MRVLITGGSGYVGSHATRELSRAGHEVILYDNLTTGCRALAKGFEFVEGDIADAAKLAPLLARVDAVMHFAASAYVGESVQNPRKYFRNNVENGLCLLDSVLASPVRMFVFSSTCAVYGVPQSLPITEDAPKNPINPYGETKLFFERVLAAYGVSHGLRSVSLRYFNAAGADPSGEIGEVHNPETHLIPLLMKAALRVGPPLKIFGNTLPTHDGTCVRDFIHVSDIGDAHLRSLDYLAQGGTSTSINLGTGCGTSIKQLIDAFERITGEKVPYEYSPPREGDPPSLYADPSRAKKILGWVAQRGINEILRSAWQWQQKIEAAQYNL